jgi:SAM-dependent methyltransferase
MNFPVGLHQRFVEQAAWTRQAQELFIQKSGLHSGSQILEVGCGTCALLASLRDNLPAQYFGIDIQYYLLDFARRENPTFGLARADAIKLPFPSDFFDAVVCHYFLLWVSDLAAVLDEIRRVTRSGGFIAALAEPDYGSQIQFPDEFGLIGKKQRDSLQKMGANPDIGRRLAFELTRSGCENVSIGILGSFNASPPNQETIRVEQSILISDIEKDMNKVDLQSLLAKDTEARSKNIRIQFVPTFFGWGNKT